MISDRIGNVLKSTELSKNAYLILANHQQNKAVNIGIKEELCLYNYY